MVHWSDGGCLQVRIHVAAPAYGMEEEIDAFFTREAPMLRMLAEARGVELVFSGILDPTMIEADREHRLAASLQPAAQRLVFVNTGFLDRTADEVHDRTARTRPHSVPSP